MSSPATNLKLAAAEVYARQALGSFPLTPAQEELWFVEQVSPGNIAYNLPEAWELTGPLRVEALRAALDDLVKRHETLRTVVCASGGKPLQFVLPPEPVDLTVVDMQVPADTSIARSAVLPALVEEARRPFDLAAGPLFRAVLYRVDSDRHVLFVNLHHIISDAASQSILIRDLAGLYQAAVDKSAPQLPELEVQFADYAVWRRESQDSDTIRKQLGYWRERLQGMPCELPLPADFSRPRVPTMSGVTLFDTVDPAIVEQLRALARASGVSLYMVLLGGFYVVLQRLAREHDLIVGSPVSARDRMETEHLIGLLVNTHPCRTSLAGDPSFTGLLARVRQTVLGTHAHQEVSLDQITREVRPDRRFGRHPLFQVVFGLQPLAAQRVGFGNLFAERVEFDNGSAKFDWTLLATDSPEGLTLRSEFSKDLFKPASAKCFLEHYKAVLSSIATEPDRAISRLPLMTENTRQEVLSFGTENVAPYERDLCVHQVFEIQARTQPDAIALRLSGNTMTYGELDRQAEALAHRLRASGIGPEVPVGVFLERSFELIVALLGVLKAGGAYVPLDKSYPPARLAFILQDTNAPVLISADSDLGLFTSYTGQILSVHAGSTALPNHSEALPRAPGMAVDNAHSAPIRSQATDLAYIMYTSGSTGTPKGVAVPHRAVVRLVRKTNYIEIRRDDTFLQFASVSFDASTFEIWGALLNGATLSIFPPHLPALHELGRTIVENNITNLWLTGGLFNQMIDTQVESLRGVRNLLTGGEALSVPHVLKAKAALPACNLINGYGPTESTTFAATYQVPAAIVTSRATPNSIPIGVPISNTSIFVLDEHFEPCPPCVPGELFIAGDGLARGYINNPKLTAGKFPAAAGSLQGPLYRTGDLVRWLPDRNLEFLGRLDQQVKIRGFRVEPEEVETVLKQSPHVRDAVVVARKDAIKSNQLVAFAVLRPGHACRRGDLQSFLQPLLPTWMIPADIVLLDELPLTDNGKVDRQRLRDMPTKPDEPTGYTLPRTSEEREIFNIWQEVLGRNSFGVNDNFFQLGGHSLLATQAISRMSQALGLELPLQLIFENPTVAMITAGIDQTRDALPSMTPLTSRRERRQRAAALLEKVGELTAEQIERLLGDPDLKSVK